jgi:iron complex outermembrane receptor protein
MPRKIPSMTLALALACPAAALGQQPVGEAPVLGEVQVEAERARSFRSEAVQVGTFRDMSPLDVPLTVNVITRPVIEAQGATGLYDALRNTAGVTRSQLNGATYDNIAIRGILVENRGNYRLNGALPVINLIDLPLENKERVEVLKGASTLYYGFVPPSGVINMVTKRAMRDPVTTAALSVNQHGAAALHGDLGRRFGEDGRFGLRINAVAGREDIGVERFSGERSLLALAFDWRITPVLGLKLDYEDIAKTVSEPAAIALLPAANGAIALPPVPDNKTNLAGEWQKYDAKARNLLARLDYAFAADWGLLLEAGRAFTGRDRNFSQFRNYDLATGAGTLRIAFQRDQEFENENYRAELFGRFTTGALAHELSFGYTLNERWQDVRSINFVEVAQNLFNPVDVARIPDTFSYRSTPLSIRDQGWYVFDRIALGERWQLMGGARWGDYRSTTTTRTFEARRVNPQVSLAYKPRPWLNLYASYLEGLEESGTAPATAVNAGEVLPPALSKQRELGAKAQLARGLLVQAAWFNLRRPSTFLDAARLFTTNGLAEYEGLELAASGELTREWALVASAMFLDAKQRNAANAATFNKIPENTPKRTASLFAEWRPGGMPGIALNAGAFYTGARAVNNANQAFIPGYTTLALGARYAIRVGGRNASLQANLENATDKDFWNTAGNGFLGVGAPRTLKLTAKIEL